MTTTISLEDLISTANPGNVILTEVSENHEIIVKYRDWDHPWSTEDDWQWENVDGPECYLCGKEAMADQQLLKPTKDNVYYTVIFKTESMEHMTKPFAPEHKGFLQCVYCFNFFHRHKCSLSLSDDTYYSYKFNGGWSCPTCVPEFRFKKRIHVQKCLDFAILVFKALYHLSNFVNGHAPFYGLVELILFIFLSTTVWSYDTG